MSEWDMPIFVPKNKSNNNNQDVGKVQQVNKTNQNSNGQHKNNNNQGNQRQQQQQQQQQYQPKTQVEYIRKTNDNNNNHNVQEEEKKVNSLFTYENTHMNKTSNNINNDKKVRYFDVAANLGSSQYAGYYQGKRYHNNDVKDVIRRAEEVGCDRLLLSASNLKDAKECYSISRTNDKFYCTVGLHPSKSGEAENNTQQYFNQLDNLIQNYGKKCVAVGECGLDYDRLFCSKKETQLKVFQAHFDLSSKYNLPLYLHSRNSRDDFLHIIQNNKLKYNKGGIDELEELLQEGLYISVNALAFKDKRDYEVIKRIPLDKIMIETDAPYCKIKPSDDGFKLLKSEQPDFIKKEQYKPGYFIKGRNEPYFVREVHEMLAAVLEKDYYEIAQQCYDNSLSFFNITE